MELRVLEYFLMVAREQTISSAAEALHITQPTLSRQMKELEEELGKQLFIRGNRHISLTEDGLLLRQRAEEIISLVEKTQADLSMTDTSLSGEIFIGAGETDGMRIIAKAMNIMQERYPLVKFHIFSGNAQEVTDKLDKGLLDFGIFVDPADMTKYDYLKLPVSNYWGVLMKKNSPYASLDSITSNELKKMPIICSNQELVKNELAGWLGGNQRKLNIISTYNLIYNASLIVEESNIYALCLNNIINTTGDSPLCFKPLEPKLEVGLTIAWKKYMLLSKVNEYFLNILKDEIKEYINNQNSLK